MIHVLQFSRRWIEFFEQLPGRARAECWVEEEQQQPLPRLHKYVLCGTDLNSGDHANRQCAAFSLCSVCKCNSPRPMKFLTITHREGCCERGCGGINVNDPAKRLVRRVTRLLPVPCRRVGLATIG